LSNGLLTENGAGLEQTEQVRTPQGGVSQEIAAATNAQRLVQSRTMASSVIMMATPNA